MLTSFYDTDIADVSQFAYQPVDFAVGLGYPAQAKLRLAAIALIVGGKCGILFWGTHLETRGGIAE